MKRNSVYPFTAIVGQEGLKEALLLTIINPLLGGVLIKGEKGTAKSTAVRALAALLPQLNVVEGCRFSCDPNDDRWLCDECRTRKAAGDWHSVSASMRVVELPVNATEDRVVGTLDMEEAIREGKKRFEPGLLARANRQILYADEVNLLDDHVVDVLLDAAAMGINTVEREGISYTHPARFVLVGTMNPEEGDIRPQLLDRFGLSVEVAGESDPETRMEVVRRRLRFEADPEAFAASYQDRQLELVAAIETARKRLTDVTASDEMLALMARLAIALDVDGHRADITAIKTAMTVAAFAGRDTVTKEDLHKAVQYVLPHRMRRRPFEEAILDWNKVDAVFDEPQGGRQA